MDAENADLRARNAELAALNARLEHLAKEMRRARFGPRSEKLDPDQLELAFEDIETAMAEAQEKHDTATAAPGQARPVPQSRGSRALPKDLPREERVIEPESLTCPCGCGDMVRIGEDRSERLDITPAQFRVLVTIRPRYACPKGLTRDFDASVQVEAACPLLIVDEADRLSIATLEHLRDLYDRYGFGLILMGMPGLEKKLARYPQLYSRIGFVHEFRPLREAEMRLVAARHAATFGIAFDPDSLEGIEALAAVIRLTRGNLRLVERLLAQMRRIMDLNTAADVTLEVVEAARDRLVIGPGD